MITLYSDSNKDKQHNNEKALNTKETPLDILLRKVVEAHDDNQPLSNEEDKSVLQKKVHEDLNALLQSILNKIHACSQ